MIYKLGPNQEHNVAVDLDQVGCRVRLTVDGQVELDRQVRDRLEHTFHVGGEPSPLRLRVALEEWRLQADLYLDGSQLRPAAREAPAPDAEAASAAPDAPLPPLPQTMFGTHEIHSPQAPKSIYAQRRNDYGNPAVSVCFVAFALSALGAMAVPLMSGFGPGNMPPAIVGWTIGLMVAAATWMGLGIGILRGVEGCARTAVVLLSLVALWGVFNLVWTVAAARRIFEPGPAASAAALALLVAFLVLMGQVLMLALSIAGLVRLRSRL